MSWPCLEPKQRKECSLNGARSWVLEFFGGSLDSKPSQQYLIQIFSSALADPSGYGEGQQRVELPEIASAVTENDEKVLAVHEALEQFAALDPQKAELVKLRYFVGMTLEQAADALGISERTAKRYWAFARAWLHEEIKAQKG